ncbi:hypothetical protein D3C85_1641120 [compost metagenome]
MQGRGVALVDVPAKVGELDVQFPHHPVPFNFGDDACRSDAQALHVSFDLGMHWGVTAGLDNGFVEQ